ncbi:DUF6932 family protein [Lewinella sp. IMCC34191]|uniref:DUF6932 family protein n=1 Tax=Lewinella sp. IMCC34191 TaxID=2259172 RepID=UPI000E225BDB|nr:hypothetical protein [Lewinella sp. IMCC34191]
MNFDQKGLLRPPEKLTIDRDQLLEVFVKAFGEDSTRLGIYENYLEYTTLFSQTITEAFAQWIGGSFTTEKQNPRDLDLVTLCSQQDLLNHQDLLTAKFDHNNWKAKGVDAYLVGVRTRDAPDYPLYRSDCVYWIHQFSTTRKDRRGRKHSRGFIELIFNDYSYE